MIKIVTKGDTKTLKRMFLLATIILGFLFVVIFTTMYVSHIIDNHNFCSCLIPIPYILALLSILGLFVGSLVAYLVAVNTLKQKLVLNELFKLSFKFLDFEDRIVLNTLFKQGGSLPQARFEKITGLHKVKVHRILDRLEAKGLLERVSEGKFNRVVLSDEFKKFL